MGIKEMAKIFGVVFARRKFKGKTKKEIREFVARERLYKMGIGYEQVAEDLTKDQKTGSDLVDNWRKKESHRKSSDLF